MKEHSARGAGVVILLVFAAFLIFNIWNGLNEKINYIEASSVKVEDIISTDATFIRDQIIITGNTENIQYLVDNGDKVAANQPICIYFKSGEASSNYRKLKEIENEIEAIEHIDSYISTGTDSVKLDGMIYTYLGEILSGIDAGKVGQVSESLHSLKQLIISRDAGLYNSTIFKDRLDELEEQKSYYSTLVDKESETVVSPCSGYFFSQTDGYEEALSSKCLDTISSEYIQGVKMYDTEGKDIIGTVINSFYWYLVTEIDSEQIADLYGKNEIELYIRELSSDLINFNIDRIVKETPDTYLLVLKSSIMLPEYLSTRFQPIDIVLNTYSGIKVPMQALHQRNGLWGVYCLEGASAKFKDAKIVYQTESYYLLEMASSSSKGLYLYDKIIVSGKDFKVK